MRSSMHRNRTLPWRGADVRLCDRSHRTRLAATYTCTGLALRIIEALDLVTLRVRSNAMLCAVRARNDIMWTRWHARHRRRRPSRARLTVCSAR